MKVTLFLPSWVEERHLRVFAGVEEVARKIHGQPWEIKAGRCCMCGRCCMKTTPNWAYGVDPQTGWCKYLEWSEGDKGYICTWHSSRPQSCATGNGDPGDGCTITWEPAEK